MQIFVIVSSDVTAEISQSHFHCKTARHTDYMKTCYDFVPHSHLGDSMGGIFDVWVDV